MPSDWSTHLSLFALGVLIGVLGFYLLARSRARPGEGSHPRHGSRRQPSGPPPGRHDPGPQFRSMEHTVAPLQVKPSPVPEAYYLWRNLTSREKEIARLAGEDKTNVEIARALRISHFTVETHIKHIYQKLKIRSRRELTRVVADIDRYSEDEVNQ